MRRNVEDVNGSNFAAHLEKVDILKELLRSDLATPSRQLFFIYRGDRELPVLVLVMFFCYSCH